MLKNKFILICVFSFFTTISIHSTRSGLTRKTAEFWGTIEGMEADVEPILINDYDDSTVDIPTDQAERAKKILFQDCYYGSYPEDFYTNSFVDQNEQFPTGKTVREVIEKKGLFQILQWLNEYNILKQAFLEEKQQPKKREKPKRYRADSDSSDEDTEAETTVRRPKRPKCKRKKRQRPASSAHSSDSD